MLQAPDLAKGVSFFNRARRITSSLFCWLFRPFYKRCRFLRYVGYLIILEIVILCVVGYEQVPITGRGRVNFMGTSRDYLDLSIEKTMADSDFGYLLESHPAVVLCKEVLQRLLSANELEDAADWNLSVVYSPRNIPLRSPA